jgi:L-aspartate oxidase
MNLHLRVFGIKLFKIGITESIKELFSVSYSVELNGNKKPQKGNKLSHYLIGLQLLHKLTLPEELTSDILVIGSGLAGLLFALHIRNHSGLSINLVTKRTLDESSTKYAQGGIAGVLSEKDSFDSHIQDTIVAGNGLCRRDVVSEFVMEAPSRIQELKQLGVFFNSIDGESVDLGGRRIIKKRRIAHVNDTTGKALQDVLVKTINNDPGIRVFEFHTGIDLVRIDGRITGAYVLNAVSGKVENFSAKCTVLATGGAGKVFLYTSNPDIASGDGIAMAYRAGATISNMELFQFHPTIYYNPNIPSFLVTEAIRGEGGVLQSVNGERFMKDVHALQELAPRDIVARAIDYEMKKSGADHVFLDISFKDNEFIKKRFPSIYSTLLRYGTDITQDPIPVVPAAHYTIGGIQTTIRGDTGLHGLYAIGEVTNTGFHGANRLASNSLVESAVMAVQSAKHVIRQLEMEKPKINSFPPWEPGDAVASDEVVIISHNWEELRRCMSNYVGIVRSNKRLLRAKQRINLLKKEIQEYYWDFHVTRDIIELRNIVHVGELIVDSALARKESRGTHYSIDYPNTLASARDTLIQKSYGVFHSHEISS